jgi:2-amino-4-hydroxy-6-hydroxymethyldihydropteridine diphosphokinase
MNELVLVLGGNIGDRFHYLEKCVEMLEKRIGNIKKQSSIYETAPWGTSEQQDYLNQALVIETELSPFECLEKCLQIENELDRKRTVRWGERTIDVDMIFYNNLIINTKNLELPHPRYHLRNFVLVPLLEIIPNKTCPELDLKISEIAKNCKDPLPVKKVGELEKC